MAHRELLDMHLVLVSSTARAILVETEHDKEVWIPKAWLEDFRECEDGTCFFAISEEHATEKELV